MRYTMSRYPKIQQLAFTLGIALLVFLFLSMVLLFWTLRTDEFEWALSPWITYIAVGLACFISTRRYKMSILLAVFVAYIFFWLTLLLVNNHIALAAWKKSILSFLALVLIAPWTVAVSAIGGTMLGKVKYSGRKN